MSTVVTKTASTLENLSIGITGATDWLNPDRAATSNNTYASNDYGGASGLGITNYLYAHDFGLAIPSDVIITGIEVLVERKGTGTTNDYYVGLVYPVDGDIEITSPGKQLEGAWPIADAVATYGAETDNWNHQLVYTETNDVAFGFAISCEGNAVDLDAALIDAITLNLYYHREFTESPSGGTTCGGTADVTIIANVAVNLGIEVLLNGHGSLIFDDVASGGVAGGGDAPFDASWHPESGGFLGGGTPDFLLTLNLTEDSSGATSGGQPDIDSNQNAIISGGLAGGGDAPFEASFGPLGGIAGGGDLVTQCFYPFPDAYAGVMVGGVAVTGLIFMEGGAVSGSAASNQFIGTPDISGGATSQGTADVVNSFVPDSAGSAGGGVADIFVEFFEVNMAGAACGGEGLVQPYFEIMQGGIALNGGSSIFPWIPESAGTSLSGSASVCSIYTQDFGPTGYNVHCSGNKVVPPNSNSFSGDAQFFVDTTTHTLYWWITHDVSGLTTVRLRGPSDRNSNASTQIHIDALGSTTSPIIGSASITTTQESQIASGLWHLLLRRDTDGVSLRAQIETSVGLTGGTSTVDKFFALEMAGGIKASSPAFLDAVDWFVITADGGATLGTTADSEVQIYASGGATFGGSAIDEKFSLPTVSAAAVVCGGSALVTFYDIVDIDGGIVIGGDSIIGIGLTTDGGLTGGSTADLLLTMVIEPSGGGLLNGSNVLQTTLDDAGIKGGVKLGSNTKSKVTFIKVRIPNQRSGAGRCMVSSNFLSQPPDTTPHLLDPIDTTAPTLSVSRFRLRHSAGWCDVEEACEQGVLPKIVQKRQGDFLPPRDGESELAVNQIATVS